MVIAVLGFLATTCLVLILVGLKLILASAKLGLTGVSAATKVGSGAIAAAERGVKSTTPKKLSGLSKAATTASQGVRRAATAAVSMSVFVIKRIIGLVETLIAFVATITGVGAMVSILFVLALVAAPTFLLTLSDTSDVNWYGNKAQTSTSQEAQQTPGTFPMPEGMDPATWAKADETGQQLAAAMINAFQNPPSMGFHYSQSNLNPGYFDCGRWIAAAMSVIGMQQDGNTREKGFDYETEGQASRPYTPTGGLNAMWLGSPAQVGNVDDPDSWAPGDMLLVPGHAALYLGKNSNGQHIIGHASMEGASGFSDPLMTKPTSDVVIQTFYPDGFTAIRPSLMLENPTSFP